MSGAAERETLILELDQDDPIRRGQAVAGLAELGDPRLVERLMPMLSDRDPVVAFKAALALARLGDEGGLELLLRGLRQADLRSFALDALIDLGPAEAIAPLQKFMSRMFLHPLERMQAAAALCRAGDEGGLLHLRKCLVSKQPEERGFALELWGRLAMPDAFALLCSVLEDLEHEHRLDALRGLVHLADERALELLRRVGREEGDEELAAEARWAVEALS